MGVPGPLWFVIIAVIVGLVLLDYFANVRRAHTPTLREATVWSAVYVGIAIAFGAGVCAFGGISSSIEYFACYVSNEALSIDNLFIFLLIVSSFAVPRIAQQKVLLFGIVLALVARTGFIFIGAALITIFDWAFYVFGILLLIMAGNLAKRSASDGVDGDTVVSRIARRRLRTSENYDGDRLFTLENGRRVMTPMLVVMIAIGAADVLFAFDSIPALFGLSQNVYLVFSATALSLLGLRQLYFLLDGLLDRLGYLSYGVSAILAFIGGNLVLRALHDNNIPFVNHGKPFPVAELSITTSLTVIIVILAITTAASLLSPRVRPQNAVVGARRATGYLIAEEGETTALPTNKPPL
jgi:tellurite resistance protein TerC